MPNIEVNITQGKQTLKFADVNVVIDVLRAFSVSFEAFRNQVKEIFFASDVEAAIALKQKHPSAFLSGEIGGYKIDGFDFGNSPYEVADPSLEGHSLVQKTTNGTAVTLHSLNAENVIVTGFTNAYATSEYIRKLIRKSDKNFFSINLIASHPSADEDLACAEYIKALVLNEVQNEKRWDETTAYRILNCEAASKYFSLDDEDFTVLDILRCAVPVKSNFVMKVVTKKDRFKILKQEF